MAMQGFEEDDQQGAGVAPIELQRAATAPRIVKFLQPDGSIWEYEDNFVMPDDNPETLPDDQENTETVPEGQIDVEIHEERVGDHELLIQ